MDTANKLTLAEHEDMEAIQANIIAGIQVVRLDVKKELKAIEKLEDISGEVSAKLNGIASELKETTDRVEAIQQRVSNMEECTADNAKMLTYALELQQNIQAKLIDLEACYRRNNIRIYGILEGAEGINMKTFLEELLKSELSLASIPSIFSVATDHWDPDRHKVLTPVPCSSSSWSIQQRSWCTALFGERK